MHFLRHSLVSSFESLYHYKALAGKEHPKANGEMMTENIRQSCAVLQKLPIETQHMFLISIENSNWKP